MCSLVVNGVAARARTARRRSASCTCATSRTATRSPSSRGGRARSRVVKDLVVDRSAFDRIIAAGGYVSINTGGAPDANAIPIPRTVAEAAMDSAACIGCGACVAACKNASAALFVGAKVSHLALLPQGQPERDAARRRAWSTQMDAEGFGNCSNEGECEAVCPKEISIANIARLRREYVARDVARRKVSELLAGVHFTS